jgi:hypothetical protein
MINTYSIANALESMFLLQMMLRFWTVPTKGGDGVNELVWGEIQTGR